MTHRKFIYCVSRLVVAITLLVLPASFLATARLQSAPNINVEGYLSVDKAQRGRTVQAAVVMDIPTGFHVNSNRPLSKYLVATQLQIEAPSGIKVGPVVYPRAMLRRFKFSSDQLLVYEGMVVLRFSVTVPANFGSGPAELKARLRYQSCNNELCFPPQTREVALTITIAGANESVKRINNQYFAKG